VMVRVKWRRLRMGLDFLSAERELCDIPTI
jgi:hypothetical protein